MRRIGKAIRWSAHDVHRLVILFLLFPFITGMGVKISPCNNKLYVQSIDVIAVRHTPHPLCNGCQVSFEIEAAAMLLDGPLMLLGGSADVLFCHRHDDCMFVGAHLNSDNLCPLLTAPEDVEEKNCKFSLGRRMIFNVTLDLPRHMFRGSYDVRITVQIKDQPDVCFWFSDINVVAGNMGDVIGDYVGAIVGFVTASASSYVIGQYFPKITNGLLPQITGFLLLGIVVGPYVTNFVSRFYIYLLENAINRISLGFISLAAGSEIYFPHLQELIWPISTMVTGVSISNFLITTIFIVKLGPFLNLPLFDDEKNETISWGVAMLMGSIMAARSPSSAVAVVNEMGVARNESAKIMIGTTVVSDLVVLVLFSMCIYLKEADSLSVFMIITIIMRLAVTAVYGMMFGHLIRLMLKNYPIIIQDGEIDQAQAVHARGSVHSGKSKIELPFVMLLKAHNKVVLGKGLLLILIVYCMFEGNSLIHYITGIEIDALLVPFFASLYVGHVGYMRDQLHLVLSIWMPTIFLPFFTLTGASLDLGLVSMVLPWSLIIALVRVFSICLGAAVSSIITYRPAEEVKFMGLTLISQAGISLGLALEVQKKFSWGRDFSSVVIGVVVINQLIGPVCCKIGLSQMIGVRPEYHAPELDHVSFLDDPLSTHTHHRPSMTDKFGVAVPRSTDHISETDTASPLYINMSNYGGIE